MICTYKVINGGGASQTLANPLCLLTLFFFFFLFFVFCLSILLLFSDVISLVSLSQRIPNE
ncbi:hypothetical protein [Helicobacter sp. MIT 05-5293]|uniref:hypothetical protein n=1 Tax=Helicobacter sp. MIT 05-5293 TaxID=1548149 RepID=UPI0013151131|nr:hypothetical protein [Helicobacter sp. MIT 05-5293]